jgi:hypothetical protein
MPVNPQSISVVIQGPIYGKQTEPYKKRFTQRCLESVRKYLPSAKIILSTWQGDDVTGLDFDVLALSEFRDFESELNFFSTGFKNHSTNKQLITTQKGLSLADRLYTLKMRSDLILTSSNFIKYFDKHRARIDDYKILEQRVLVCSNFTLKWEFARRITTSRSYYFCHVSDWICFGLTNDVKNIYEIPFENPSNTKYYLRNDVTTYPNVTSVINHQSVFLTPEQYVWSKFLQKNGYFIDLKSFNPRDITCLKDKRLTENEKYYLDMSNLSILNNLVSLNPYQIGIKLPKCSRSYRAGFWTWRGMYTYYTWVKMYKKYIVKSKFWFLTMPDLDLAKRILTKFRNFVHIV